MYASRHKTSFWIKKNSLDVSIKNISGMVTAHWHEFYEIELILEGSGVYNIDGIDYEIKKGALFAMSPSSFHFIDFKKDTKLINVMFTLDGCEWDFLCNIFKDSPHVTLNLSDNDIYFVETITKEMLSTENKKHQNALLNSILGKIQNLNSNSALSFSDNQMQQAVLYIQNNFRENITLNKVAKIANYSPNYFGNKFKLYTGVTFKQYILDLRFLLAEKLLKHSDMSVVEISAECGFNDFSNFMVYFKNKHKMTPGEFRKSK